MTARDDPEHWQPELWKKLEGIQFVTVVGLGKFENSESPMLTQAAACRGRSGNEP
jgi:hypothetical protein